MGYVKFDKEQLINLSYSLSKEMVRSNRAGSFSCTTILGCNTRKYHGLLITPQPELDGGMHVLLSKVDETVIQHDADFNLGVNKFPGSYNPKGHKYVRDFSAEVIPVVTYRVGGVILTKETMFVTHQERVLIKYTLVEANSATKLRIRPFLAFRNIHALSKRNIDLNTHYDRVANGIKVKMYEGYADLFVQFSKKEVEYTHVPDWFNDFEYIEEQQRGYAYHEDLYNPGFFEIPLKKGESIIFSAATEEIDPALLTTLFRKEYKKRTPRNSFENCLKNSGEQFFYTYHEKSGIIAGYPWYGRVGRYTFMSLPGLHDMAITNKQSKLVIKSMIDELHKGSFPEISVWKDTSYASADTPLWFFWAIQKSIGRNATKSIWHEYGQVMTYILESYAQGWYPYMQMHDNKLIHIDADAPALTWMNAIVYDEAITPRYGYVVEVNALWYNAVCFAIKAAKAAKDAAFVKLWKPIADAIKTSFNDVFWNSGQQYLADFVYRGKQDMSIRPNQIIALSVPFSPVNDSYKKAIIDIVAKDLLTPRGLRTLSPTDLRYKGRYEGDAISRDLALHQGSVWPWLSGHFAEACLAVYGQNGLSYVEKLYDSFKDVMKEHGVGSISELYDGNPPHAPGGAISFAPSVAEVSRIYKMVSDISTSRQIKHA